MRTWTPPQAVGPPSWPLVEVGYALTTDPGSGRCVVPDGRCGIAVLEGRPWWIGPGSRAWLPDRAGIRVVGVRLAPTAGRLVAGGPLGRWRDRRVPLAQVWGRSAAADLEAVLHDCVDDVAKVAAATTTVRARVGDRTPPVLTVELAALVRSEVAVADMASRLGMSVRQVHRRCVDDFGLPPSVLRRIARLHRAVRLGQSVGVPGLSAVAAEAGFADQAHLCREFRVLAGQAPGAALGARPRPVAADSSKTLRPAVHSLPG